MTTNLQIAIAEDIIATGIVNRVYHSCQLLRDEHYQQFIPVYRKGAEQPYAGIDDTKGLFAYIRANGDIAADISPVVSCENAYKMKAPLRVVFFSDNEKRDFDLLISRLTAFTFSKGVRLTRIITDAGKLVKDEQPIFQHQFDGQTFYAAFDITVTFVLLPNQCEQTDCAAYVNPICKK